MTIPQKMEIIEIIIFINRTMNGINIESCTISIKFMNGNPQMAMIVIIKYQFSASIVTIQQQLTPLGGPPCSDN